MPRQECIDLVIGSQPTLAAKRQQPSPEEIEVDRSEEDGIEDDRCSGSTRELNDDIEEVGSAVSPTCFVTEFGQTEVHFEASDPVDDIGDSL